MIKQNSKYFGFQSIRILRDSGTFERITTTILYDYTVAN